MGSGDLNMKKSWHPQTLANQRRVAEEKRKAEEEAKRVAKMQKELREERQREEMDQLNASVTQKSINKLEWMYNAPSTGMPQTSEDREEYLLGKRDAMSLLRDKESRESERLAEKPESKWKEGLFAFSNREANNERDSIAKTMEDPLADIKRREQAAIQAMLSNPLNRKRIGLDGGIAEDGDNTKDADKKKKKKHRRRGRESGVEREERDGRNRDRKSRRKDDDGRSDSRGRTHRRSTDNKHSRSKERHHRKRESRRDRRSVSPDDRNGRLATKT